MLTVKELAARLEAKLVGAGDQTLTGIKPIGLANEHDLSFYAPSTKRNQKDFSAQLLVRDRTLPAHQWCCTKRQRLLD